MGMTALLEVLIGLALLFFLTSIICSGINELIAQQLGRRGKFLREGMMNLVADRWLYLRLINHPIVSSLYRDLPGKPRTPSYIPGRTFATALIDVVLSKAAQLGNDGNAQPSEPATFDAIRAAALKCKERGYTSGDVLLPLLDAAHGDLERAHANIAGWYEAGMDRVSGWYKRYTRKLLFITGLFVAVLFNVDTLNVAKELGRSAELRRSLVDAAEHVVETGRFGGVKLAADDPDVMLATADLKKLAQAMATLESKGLPVGFSCLEATDEAQAGGRELGRMLSECWKHTKERAAGSWLLKMVGWLITALAVSLGAPFWFDLMKKFMDVRGAGTKPKPVAAF